MSAHLIWSQINVIALLCEVRLIPGRNVAFVDYQNEYPCISLLFLEQDLHRMSHRLTCARCVCMYAVYSGNRARRCHVEPEHQQNSSAHDGLRNRHERGRM